MKEVLAYTDLTRGAALFGPTGAGVAHALGAGCAWLWSCGGARRPVVRRYLWRGLRSDNYRSDTTFAVRSSGARGLGSRSALDLRLGIVSEGPGHLDPWIHEMFLESPGTPGAFFCRCVYRQVPNQAASAGVGRFLGPPFAWL